MKEIVVLNECKSQFELPESPLFWNGDCYWVDIKLGLIFRSDLQLNNLNVIGLLEDVSSLIVYNSEVYAVNKTGLFRLSNRHFRNFRAI